MSGAEGNGKPLHYFPKESRRKRPRSLCQECNDEEEDIDNIYIFISYI